MSADRFREGQELTRALREELKRVREDVDAIVRGEVERSGLDPARVHALVRDAVARELDARTPWALARMRWVGPAVGAAVGLALGMSLFALFSVRSLSRDAGPAIAIGTQPTMLAHAPVPPLLDAAASAARYDSLFVDHASVLDPLVARVEAASSDPGVRTAVAAWKLGRMSPELRDRLHAALVQEILRAEIDSTLAVDGGILREPCRGRTCAALLRLWEERGAEFGLPPYSASSAADADSLRLAERLLVLSALEGGEG